MPYCVHCGVELADSEKNCPLCQTPVPENERKPATPPFPQRPPVHAQHVSRRSLVLLLAVILALPVLLSVISDLRMNGQMVWSGYVLSAEGMLFVWLISLILGSRRYAIAWLTTDFAATALFLYLVERMTGGGLV